MKLIGRYLQNIKLKESINYKGHPSELRSAFLYYQHQSKSYFTELNFNISGPFDHTLDQESLKSYYYNIKEVSFQRLYGNLLISFYDNGTIKHLKGVRETDIERIRKYINNQKTIDDRVYLNRILLHVNNINSRILFDLFAQYISHFYSELIHKYKENIIFVNTDHFFYKGNESEIECQLKELDIDYIVKEIPIAYFEAPRKYVFIQDGETRHVGIRDEGKIAEIVNKLKQYKRNCELDLILNI